MRSEEAVQFQGISASHHATFSLSPPSIGKEETEHPRYPSFARTNLKSALELVRGQRFGSLQSKTNQRNHVDFSETNGFRFPFGFFIQSTASDFTASLHGLGCPQQLNLNAAPISRFGSRIGKGSRIQNLQLQQPRGPERGAEMPQDIPMPHPSTLDAARGRH